jgi:beta-glucosidase
VRGFKISLTLTGHCWLECTWGANVIHDNLLDAMANGSVPRPNATAALSHLFRLQFRLGMFDAVDTQPYLRIGLDAINSAPHQQLALEAARQVAIIDFCRRRIRHLTC